MQKAEASIQFVRGDVAPYNALGDAHVNWAERLIDSEAMQHLQLALDLGYAAALHINASCTEALLGVGEVHSKMGKLCLRNGSSDTDAHFQRGVEAYDRALQSPSSLGSLHERFEARYNYACALSLGQHKQKALSVLDDLLFRHGVSANDLMNDADFENMRDLPEFQQLLKQANAHNATGGKCAS